MWKFIYLGAGGLLIGSYLTFSLLGMEIGTRTRESVPTIKAIRSANSSSRSRHGYYGGGGWGFGK